MLENAKERRAIRKIEKERRREEERIEEARKEQELRRREIKARLEEERKEYEQIEAGLKKAQQEIDYLKGLDEKELFVELVIAARGLSLTIKELQDRQTVHKEMIEDLKHSVESIDYDEEISELWRAINGIRESTE